MKKLTVSTMIIAALILAAGVVTVRGEAPPEIADYPIDYCVVSGQKLGSMGTPVDYMHEGRLVRFCCSGCIATFQANPEKYLAVLDQHQAPAKTEGGENPATTTAGCRAKPAPAKTGCSANPAPGPARGCRPGCRP